MVNMFDAPPLHTGRFYRIKGIVIYCTSYTITYQESTDIVRMEGCQPQDYAAYMAQCIIGENKHPYRTAAEIEDISYPELIEVTTTTHSKITELSKEEALGHELLAKVEGLIAKWSEPWATRNCDVSG